MTEDWHRKLESLLGDRALRDAPLRRYTTWQVGGPADVMCLIETEAEAARVVQVLVESEKPWLVIGKGSNLLVSDDGVEGAVLLFRGDLARIEAAGETQITAGAGAALSQVLRFAAARHLTCLEFAAGIPGSLGGAVMMNAGAFGRQMKDVVDRVRIMDRTGAVLDLPRDHLSFDYRRLDLPDKTLVLEGRLALRPGNRRDIESEVNRRLLDRRRSQPLSQPSAGSVFRNPPGDHAGRLIESCGLKGRKIGGAQVSEKHANFILNLGNATAADILALMRQVVREVKDKTDVTLFPEVRLVGRGMNGSAIG
ncbi:MAG: UDP-N-acetylmuramate dehydrogenase [Proteobacteria bacterium]|nr:UDP-N-acetylmuramate dehydrogenase [Pseudomonadota bacterium]